MFIGISPDMSVGVTTGYGLDSWSSIPDRDKSVFSTASRPALGPTQPPIKCVPVIVSPGIKQPGRDAEQSPPSSTEVENGGAIPSLPHMSSWRGA
jgi:hypothetical protein